jgi:hypothetical protein
MNLPRGSRAPYLLHVATDVLLAVIGPRSSELLTARANDPDDFVAIERPPARRNAVGLRPERFRADCQGLVKSGQRDN